MLLPSPEAPEAEALTPITPEAEVLIPTSAMYIGPSPPAGSSGFSTGYFCIKSLATDRLLDVAGDSVADGAPVILWLAKELSLVESLRDPAANNQVFFIDSTGALCSRASGHAIDVQASGRLVLRHRRPMTDPYPSQYSHPLPQFSYDKHSGQIYIEFSYNPTFSQRDDWTENKNLLTSVPKRRQPTSLDHASAFFSSALTSSMAALSGIAHTEPTPEQVYSGDIDLKEDEILEQDRSEENEIDDSQDPLRLVSVISIRKADVDAPVGTKAALRRQWEVLPVRELKARSGNRKSS